MIYRKHGAVVRWESGTLLRVVESGVAIEENEFFECHPEPAAEALPDPSEVLAIVSAIRERVGGLSIERMVVTHGAAQHECEDRRWSETGGRFHLSIVHGGLRVLVDSSTARLDDVAPAAEALSRAGPEREAPPRLRLAPSVTAALLPALARFGRVVQSAGGVDGYGHPIVEATGEPWPNWYRPSYRIRPVRAPLNLRLECDRREIDEGLPLAVALHGPPQGSAVRVLVVDGQAVYPALVRAARPAAVSHVRIWYPYGGGSFGAELVL